MGDVYKNAVLNIAATGASDSNGGCFTNRDPALVQRIEMKMSWTWGPGQYQIFDQALWRHGVTCAPLNTRAWVIQERVLAKRVLHFGSNQIYWECGERVACETFPEMLPMELSNDTPRFNSTRYFGDARITPFHEDWLGLLKPDPEHIYHLHDLWSNTVAAYTRCQLTYQTDKLIAISGLAKDMARLVNDEYLAGLWRRHLPYHLLWFLEKPSSISKSSKGSQSYIAPSWSWASTIGQVKDHPISKIKGEEILINILEARTETVTSDKTGQCTDGFLKIRGMLKEAHWAWWDDGEMYTLMFEGVRADFTIALPDCLDFVTEDVVYCMPVHRFELDPDEPRLYGLVLGKIEGKGNIFKRLGHFKVDFDVCDAFESESLPVQEFTII